MNSLTFTVAGLNSEARAHSLAARIGAELEIPVEVARAPARTQPGDKAGPDGLTVATFILSIPPAILAVADLAERMKLVKRLQSLLDWIASDGGDVTVTGPGLPPSSVRRVDPSALLATAPAASLAPPPAWDIFIAHATADADAAVALYERLASRCRTFLALRSVQPGDVWPVAIARAEEQSSVIAILASPHLEGGWYLVDEVVRAVQLARNGRCRVVPVYLSGFPNDLRSIPYGLGVLHGIDASADVSTVADRLLALVPKPATA